MIKVEIQGVIFECETPQQAVEIAKLMKAGNQPARGSKSAAINYEMVADTIANPSILDLNKNPALRFLYRIKDFPAADVSSGSLAKALDVKGTSGIGPRLAKLEQQLAELQPPVHLDSLLEKHVRPGQPILWKIRPGVREIWRMIEDSLL